jgi:hypothetical protein
MGDRQSMAGYFEHIGGKTYIDKYPSTIIYSFRKFEIRGVC